MEQRDLLLYLDLPFCPRHCPYCAKPALEPLSDRPERYLDALRREVEAQAGSLPEYRIAAVWVGGGIPGHMADEKLGALLRDLPTILPLAPETEITLKVHPGMVSAETLDACRRGKVTRLSVEYVTSNYYEHKALGRFLSPDAMDTTRMVLGSFGPKLSFDLLTGLPGQTPASFVESLKAAIGYGAVHISLYPFAPAGLPGREAASSRPAREGEAFLTARGFREYLPHRWALEGEECRFFRLEDRGTEVLGCGLGAVSAMDGVRSVNTSQLERYLRFSPRPDQLICRAEAL